MPAPSEARPPAPLAELRSRLISFASMGRSLRLITGFGIALLLASGLLIVLRDLTMPQVSVDYATGQLSTMGVVTFGVSLGLLALAWAYLLAGVAHTAAPIRGLGLVLFTLAMGWRFAGLGLSAAGFAAAGAALALIWISAWATLVVPRLRARMARRPFAVLLVPVLFIEVLLVYGAVWWGLADAYQFPFAVTDQLSTVSQFLVPMLVLAGVDLAELADVVVGALTAAAAPRLRPLLAALASVAVAVAVLVSVAVNGTDVVGEAVAGVALSGLVLALLWFRLRRRRAATSHAHVPLRSTALLAAAVAFFVVAPTVMASILPPPPVAPTTSAGGLPTSVVFGDNTTLQLVAYRHPSAPRFGISYPEIWQAQTDLDEGPQGRTVVEFNGTNVKDSAFYLVAAVPMAGHPDEEAAFRSLFGSEVCPGGCTPARTATREQGGATLSDLSVTFATGGTASGRVRSTTQDGFRWWQISLAAPGLGDLNAPVFAAMDRTFTTTPAEPASVTNPYQASADLVQQRFSAAEEALALLAFVVCAVLLVLRRGRGWRALDAGLLFALVATGMYALHNPGDLVGVFGGATLAPLLDVDGFRGVTAALSLLGLAVTALWWRGQLARLAALLLTLNAGLQLVTWIIALYSGAQQAGRFSLAQAAIIVIALLFDVTASGNSITNQDSRAFPRHARILLFLGYIVMTAVAVTYFSSEHVQATQATVEAQFESEAWVQFGLTLLGAPLLATLFLLRRRSGTPAEVPGVAAP
ncbi:MAG: hypothetical protein ACYDAC_09705 [Candidatus Dormibacteria bacterium]